jgi:uncharacterized protein YkwD
VLSLLSCVVVPSPVEQGGGRVVRVEGAGVDREVAAGVVSAANRARGQAGAEGLVVVEGMSRAAQAHAEHLRGRHELDHTSWIQGRKDPAARLDAEGVKWTRVGENLAQLSDRAGIPDATIQIWMNSPGHRHNLLDPLFNTTGVGVARDERGTYYIVQMYATQ